ncbi:MAG: ABC transporter substrate-binding protein [Casimicrobiaceae bacterium]
MRIARLAAVCCAALMTAAAAAQTPVRVILFPGGATAPMWVAADQGYFAAEGLAVKLTLTPSSVFLAEAMMKGDQDVALATFDNVVGYQEGQGEAKLPTPPDFFAFMSVMHGTVHLMASPEIKAIADLKGKSLGVDAVSTGYSLAMMKLLQSGGLQPGDYTLEPIGNTGQRQKLLLENKTVATILTTPLDLLPKSKGYRELADFGTVVGPYQAIVGFTRRAWAEANRDTLVRFTRASVAGLDWLLDPANQAEAVALYRKHLPDVPEAAAIAAVKAMTGSRDSFSKGGRFDMPGVENVLKLRSEFGRPQKNLTDSSRYLDETYLRAATAPR